MQFRRSKFKIKALLITSITLSPILSECLVQNCITCIEPHKCGMCSTGYSKSTRNTTEGTPFDICTKEPSSNWPWYLLGIISLLACLLLPLYFLWRYLKGKKVGEDTMKESDHSDVKVKNNDKKKEEIKKKKPGKKIMKNKKGQERSPTPSVSELSSHDNEFPSTRREFKENYRPRSIIKSPKKGRKKVRFEDNYHPNYDEESKEEVTPTKHIPKNKLERAKIETTTPEKIHSNQRHFKGKHKKSPFLKKSPYKIQHSPFKTVYSPNKENLPHYTTVSPHTKRHHLPHPISPRISITPEKLYPGPAIYNYPQPIPNVPNHPHQPPQKRVVLARHQTDIYPPIMGHFSPNGNFNAVTPIKVTSENNIQIPMTIQNNGHSPLQAKYVTSNINNNNGSPFIQSPIREVSRVINAHNYGPRNVGNGAEISPESINQQIIDNIFRENNQYNNGETQVRGENSPSPHRETIPQIITRQNLNHEVKQRPKAPQRVKTIRVLGDSENLVQLPHGEVYRGKTDQLSSTKKRRKEKEYHNGNNEDLNPENLPKEKPNLKEETFKRPQEENNKGDFEKRKKKIVKHDKKIPRKQVIIDQNEQSKREKGITAPKYRKVDMMSKKDFMKNSVFNKPIMDSSLPSSFQNSMIQEKDPMSMNSSKIAHNQNIQNNGSPPSNFQNGFTTKVMRVRTSHNVNQNITLFPLNLQNNKGGENDKKEEVFYIHEEERNGQKVRVLRVLNSGQKQNNFDNRGLFKVRLDDYENKENYNKNIQNNKIDLSELDGSFITDNGSLALYNPPELTYSENETIFNNNFEKQQRPQMLKNTQKIVQKNSPSKAQNIDYSRYVNPRRQQSPNFGKNEVVKSSFLEGSYDDLGLYTSPVSRGNTSYTEGDNSLPLIVEERFEDEEDSSFYNVRGVR